MIQRRSGNLRIPHWTELPVGIAVPLRQTRTRWWCHHRCLRLLSLEEIWQTAVEQSLAPVISTTHRRAHCSDIQRLTAVQRITVCDELTLLVSDEQLNENCVDVWPIHPICNHRVWDNETLYKAGNKWILDETMCTAETTTYNNIQRSIYSYRYKRSISTIKDFQHLKLKR